MVESEVPTATCIRTSSGIPRAVNSEVEHRHDDDAAADPEEAGDEPRGDAGREQSPA